MDTLLINSTSFGSLSRTPSHDMDSFNPFKRFVSKKSSSNPRFSSIKTKEPKSAGSLPRRIPDSNPFPVTQPTRRPMAAELPPAYAPPEANTVVPGVMSVSADSPYAFLSQFDTVFLIDDSGSMAGRSWTETKDALRAIAPICTQYDSDGIDIYFLNHRNRNAQDKLGGYTNVTSAAAVDEIFSIVRPLGGTPTGTRLNQILKPYCAEVEKYMQKKTQSEEGKIKPLNIIVITDGVPSDDVESVIVMAAKSLDKCEAEPWQVGIQFFQVGREPEAAEDLRELDDALSGKNGIRDIVDTVPWTGNDGQVLTADGLLKVCLGSVVRRLDRKQK